jgi:hypothetical protein
MKKTWGAALCGVLGMTLLMPVVGAAQEQSAPIATVRFKSIEGMLEDLRYVLKMSNKDEEADKLDGVTMVLGMAGIDQKRPFGGYVQLAERPEDSPVLFVLPLEDENLFFNFLGTAQVRPARQPDGSYSLGTLNLPVDFEFYFRVAHKHLYLTLKNRDNLDPKKLLAPERFLEGGASSVASLRVDFRPLPESLRRYAIENFHLAIEREKQKDAGAENRVDRKLRLAVADFLDQSFKTLVHDSAELAVDVTLDRKMSEIAARLNWKAKEGTKLHRKLQALEPQPSRFSGLAENSAASVVLHWAIPDSVRPLVIEAFDRAAEQSNRAKKSDVEKQLDKRFFEAWRPTVREGRLDAALMLTGPDNQGQYSFAAGVQVKEPDKIATSFDEIEKAIPSLAKTLVQLQAVKVDEQPARRIVAPLGKPQLAEIFGDKTTIHLAVQKDVIWLTGEAEGANQLKAALGAKAKPAPLLAVNVSLSHLARLLPDAERKASHQTWQGDPQGADRMALVIRGGDSLSIDFRMQAKVLTFFANLLEIQRSN